MNYFSDDSRIQTDGKGASMPVSNNNSDDCSANNRGRVREVIIEEFK
jgi:outer membrane protein OmpA-like peptidoglycan-associated protein